MKNMAWIAGCIGVLFVFVSAAGCGGSSSPPVTNSAGTPTALSANIGGGAADAVSQVFENSPEDLQKNCELMSRSGRYIVEAEWIKSLSNDEMPEAKREEVATAAAAYLEEHC
jgi:hypothetical protein